MKVIGREGEMVGRGSAAATRRTRFRTGICTYGDCQTEQGGGSGDAALTCVPVCCERSVSQLNVDWFAAAFLLPVHIGVPLFVLLAQYGLKSRLLLVSVCVIGCRWYAISFVWRRASPGGRRACRPSARPVVRSSFSARAGRAAHAQLFSVCRRSEGHCWLSCPHI